MYLVTAGTVIGHSFCTALAVIGGRYVSTKISVKHGASQCIFFLACLRLILPSFLPVTLGGAALFLLFGIIYLYEAFAVDMDHNIPEHL